MKISVAMATYNGEVFIEEQLQSIIDQSQQVDEIVVIDDCSQDKTLDIVDQFAKAHSSIHWIIEKNSKNLGYILNFKKALSLATGNIVFLSDQDDVWKENKIEIMMEIMQKNHQILALGSSFDAIDGSGHPIEIKLKRGYSNNNFIKQEFLENELIKIDFNIILIQNFCQGCTMAIRRRLINKFLKLCVDNIPHDWQICLLAGFYGGAYFLNTPLIEYRMHQNNTLGIGKPLTIKRQLALNIPMIKPKEVLNNIFFLEKVKKQEKYNEVNLKKFAIFLQKNIKYLENKNFFQLLGQIIFQHRYYKKIKSIKGRIVDLLYAMPVKSLSDIR